ncbi:DUF2142 domain-containing protein [Lacisediminihabitans profunda]|uniref:DUF2142 domain-containing protein n=1 Tax=Lacisediminihabitans profunda TaxID=2594790 RepID=A0A5C8UJ59_9MICO|nr:DUF2142 domain-containing protein [Lacisediminihabitans profunda]TXN28229.1 DUF2142 domain-containing protein [Lacisediminihabitans profunda]
MTGDHIAGDAERVAGRWRVFLVSFAVLLAPMLLWALGSPLASVPDEPAHAIRAAAVVRGESVTEAWVGNPSTARADVPAYVADMVARACFARHPRLTPACAVPIAGDPEAIVTTGTSAGNNSPVYYAIVGLPTLFLHGDVALYGMRFVNALLCAAALAVMVMQLSTLSRSRWATAGAVVGLTPMVFFLCGSINPNAIEVASGGALFATLLALVRSNLGGAVLWERTVLTLVTLTLLVNTRSISLLWALVIVGAVLAVTPRKTLVPLFRTPAVWLLLGASAAISGAAAFWYAHPTPFAPDLASTQTTGSAEAFRTMLVRTFDFASSYVGDFGWLDTPSPAFSVIVWSAAIVALILVAFVWGSGRSRWVAIGFGMVMVVVPPVVQAILAPQLGYIWQGRYMLAMLVCLLVACGLSLDDSLAEEVVTGRPRRLAAVGIALLAIGQVASFAWTLRRYAVGVNGSFNDMLTNPAWQPPLGWIALTVAMAAWAAVAAWLVFRHFQRGGENDVVVEASGLGVVAR